MGLRVTCGRGNTLLTLSYEKDSEILEAATRSQLLFLSVHTILTLYFHFFENKSKQDGQTESNLNAQRRDKRGVRLYKS